MAEVMVRDGTWTFDGELLRIVPGRGRSVKKLRQLLGEIQVPLEAVAGIAYEPGKKSGRLRLRLREGADPFSQATRGRIPEAADPYQLVVDAARTSVAEYFVDEVRNALVIEQVPDGPCDRYLMPGPALPVVVAAGDGTVTFDGESMHLEWNWATEESKRSAGPQRFTMSDLIGVEWFPTAGLENGYLRFQLKNAAPHKQLPKHDPHCLVLWGFDKETRMTALLVTAILVRLRPATKAPATKALAIETPLIETPLIETPATKALSIEASAIEPAATGGGDDPDALLRRLRELGDLHRDGVLTEEEFVLAKQALLRRL